MEIAEQYFKACYGLEDQRPSVDDISFHIQQFVAILGTSPLDASALRKQFGILTCLHQQVTTPKPDCATVDCSGGLGNTTITGEFFCCLHAADVRDLFGIESMVTTLDVVPCLAFVVDTTGSMAAEIMAVQALINGFVDPADPVCYILVDFNDIGGVVANSVFLRAVFDPTGMLPGSGTLASFTAAVNALFASGGRDCPEFGMDSLLLALDQISGLPPLAASLSQIILVTDASSHNDNLFTDVITQANALGVIIHGLLIRDGCGLNFGNFPVVISATGGIAVNNLGDFGVMTNFVQATLVSGGFGGDAMFGLALSSHTVTVSKFATVLQVLIRTSDPQVTIMRPNGTTEVLSVTGTLAFFEDEDSETGDWMFSIASGTLEIAVNSPILLDVFVSHIIDDPDSDGILPVCEPPQCYMGRVAVSTSRLSDLTHPIYLAIVNTNGSIVDEVQVLACEDVLVSDDFLAFPTEAFRYQLRGYDCNGNNFSFTSQTKVLIELQPPTTIVLDDHVGLSLNSGETETVSIQLQHDAVGNTLFFNVSGSDGLTLENLTADVVVPAGGVFTVTVTVSVSSSLAPGSTAFIYLTVVDPCSNNTWMFHCSVLITGAAPPECTDGEIRLVNGTTERNGRVEMCYGGIWGSVCNHFWDDTDASVVCRELGHNSTGAVAILESTSVFGRGIGPFVLDDVECSGAESSLSECSHPGFRVHNCFRYQEAGVSCREGTVEECDSLQEESGSEFGDCEVYQNGSDICDTVFTSGVDYIYLPHRRGLTTQADFHRKLHDAIGSELSVSSQCQEVFSTYVCSSFFFPCGKGGEIHRPNSVCSDDCLYVQNTCSELWEVLLSSELGMEDFADCNTTGEILEPLEYCCVNAMASVLQISTVLDLTATPSTINEGNFGIPITISLVSGSGRPSGDVVITFAVSGTATAGLDYEAPGDFTYTTFGNDDQSFNLEIDEDSIAELSETIILTASVLSGTATFNTDTVTLILNDEDEPFFELNTADVVESVGSAVVGVELRGTEIAFDIEVTVVTTDPATSPSPATAGDDYTATSFVITFLSGSVEGATQNVNIPINNDNLVERPEVFDVQLLVPGTTPLAYTGSIAIFDDDVAIFELLPSTSDVDEDVPSGLAQVFVQLAASSGELTFDIDVTIETVSGGTATVIDDYAAATVIRTFTSGSNSGTPAQSLDIPIVNDLLDELTETIFVQGSESDASAQFQSGADTATVSILDDDVPNASFLPFPPSVAPILNDVNEADGFALVRVELGGAILTSAFEVTVQTIAGGTATAGADYTATTVVLTFMPGDGPGTTLDASIPILEDTLVEGPTQETISVQLIAVGSSENGTVRITDNDANDEVPIAEVPIAEIAASGFILLLLMICFCIITIIVGGMYFRKVKRLRRTALNLRTTPGDIESSNAYGMSAQRLVSSPETKKFKKQLSEANVLIPGRHIHLLDMIGRGEFGMVYRARLGNRNRGEIVAVKTPRDFTPDSIHEMIKESLKMKAFNHPNVLSVIGVSIDAGPTPYIVMPFMANGTLLAYLKKERPNLTIANGASNELICEVQKRLLSMCLQIAHGMEYLAAHNFIHRDVAARNCMLDPNFVIKVADFGLSENLYAKKYFREGKGVVKLPYKWMALESLCDSMFTEKTDVWSFGVTCWEIFSLGKTPYPATDPYALITLLESGLRLQIPYNAACSLEIFAIISQCWKQIPDQRPTFTELVSTINTVLEKIAGYMSITTDPSTFKKRPGPDKEEEDTPVAKKPKKGYDTLPQSEDHTKSLPSSHDDVADESGDERENVKRKFLVEMPEDFYQFWEFCKTINPSKPEMALKSILGLELVGPYHVLAGRLKGAPWDKCVLHCRYFYDPPEFLTVMKGEESTGFHIGYFRDDPKSSTNCIVVSNCAKVGCDIKLEAENIFGAIKLQISSRLEDNQLGDGKRKSLAELQDKLVSKAHHFGLTLGDTKSLVKKRNKEVVAKCFHKIGIVVPYDETTEVGYRPLPMNDRELRKLLDRIANCTDPVKRDRLFEPLQEIVTFVQFANDECDYGMGFELGIDLFCHGDQFHNVVEHLLPLAYDLLQREPFAKIAQEHLKHRNQIPLDFSSLDSD